MVLLLPEQDIDRTPNSGDCLGSIDGDSRSGGAAMSFKRPFPARRIDGLDHHVFNPPMFVRHHHPMSNPS
ncbi:MULTISPECIES: hypothetical protein [Bradyrhizobium]|uniref:hypothetical protein n=1 Tax=Bradyrhizobium TaxID=374 RepID=UPI001152A88F|nr:MULTISPECIES: hypothetical protein [Bradyrhizobium]